MESPELNSADEYSATKVQLESIQAKATDDNEDVFVSKAKMAENDSEIPDLGIQNLQVNTGERSFGKNLLLRRNVAIFPCQEEMKGLGRSLQTSANPSKDVLCPGPGKYYCSPESDDKDADYSVYSSVQDKSGPETTRVAQGATGDVPETTSAAAKTTGAETEDHPQTDTQAKRDPMGINMHGEVVVTANPPEPDKDTPVDKLIHERKKQYPNVEEDLDVIKRLIHPNLISNREIFPFLKRLQEQMKGIGIKILKTLHVCFKNMNQESLSAEFEKTNFCSLYQKKDLTGYKFVLVPLLVLNHWILLVADVTKEKISVLDSSMNPSLTKDKWIELWRCLGIGSSLQIDWKVGELESGKQDRPPDNDQSSCGAFLMLNAFLIVLGIDPSRCTLQDAIDFRMYVLVRNKPELIKAIKPDLDLRCRDSQCKVQSAIQFPCGKCQAWFHLSCIHPESRPKDLMLIICQDCKKREIQRTLFLERNARLTTTRGLPVMQPDSQN